METFISFRDFNGLVYNYYLVKLIINILTYMQGRVNDK